MGFLFSVWFLLRFLPIATVALGLLMRDNLIICFPDAFRSSFSSITALSCLIISSVAWESHLSWDGWVKFIEVSTMIFSDSLPWEKRLWSWLWLWSFKQNQLVFDDNVSENFHVVLPLVPAPVRSNHSPFSQPINTFFFHTHCMCLRPPFNSHRMPKLQQLNEVPVPSPEKREGCVRKDIRWSNICS